MCVSSSVCVCVSVYVFFQCRGRADGDLLCPQHGPRAGEGSGHPGCVPDSEEPEAAEAAHGAETGERLLTSFTYYIHNKAILFAPPSHVFSLVL